MKKSVVEELRNFPEKTATTVSLLYYIGSRYVAVPLKRDARFAGKSGYNLSKMLGLTFARIFSSVSQLLFSSERIQHYDYLLLAPCTKNT